MKHAAVERYQRSHGCVAAGAAGEMDHLSTRLVHRLPSGFERSQTEIRVFPIHEKTFIEAAENLKDIAADHHERPSDPVDLGTPSLNVGRGEIASRQRIAGNNARQPRSTPAKRGGE